MKMIATRELAANSGRVMEELDAEGMLVITKDGKPRSILLPTSDDTLMEDLRACVYSRALQMLRRAQSSAAASGTHRMTMKDIDWEIKAARKNRR